MAYRIEIREAESTTDRTWHDVTDSIVSTGFKVRSGFASLGSNADLGKLSLTYRAYDLATASIFGSTVKRIKVVKDGRTIFEGYSDSASSVESTENKNVAWVKITAYPYINALKDVELSEDFVAYDMPAKNVAETMWNKALEGCKSWIKEAIEESVTITFPDINDVIPLVKASKGDKPIQLILEMMSEYCYSIYTGNSGIVAFIKPYEEDPSRYAEIPFESIFSKPTIKTSPYVRKKCPQVTLSKTVSHDNVLIYSLSGEEGENVGEEIYAGEYYPSDADGEISYYSTDFENDMVTFAWAKNPFIRIESTKSDFSGDGDLEYTRIEMLGDKTYYRLRNKGEVSCWLNQLRIFAETAYFYDKSIIVRSNGEGDKNEVETKWIQNEIEAKEYAKAIADESRCNTSTVSFKSDVLEETIVPGMLVKLGDIPAVYLVKSVEWDLDNDTKVYSCIVYDVSDIDTEMLYRSASPTRGPKGENAPAIYYLWSSSPDNLIVPKHAFWRFKDIGYMMVDGILLGDFSLHDWLKDWDDVMNQRSDDFPFLWAKVGENGQPFLLQGTPGADGQDAFVFSIKPDETTIIKDMRSQDSQTLSFTVDKSGYKGETIVFSSVGKLEGNVITLDRKQDSVTISAFSVGSAYGTIYDPDKAYFMKNEDGSWVAVQVTEDNYQEYSVEEVHEVLTISCIDITGQPTYIGVFETESNLPDTYSNSQNLIDGDYAIVDKPDGTNPKITLYEYKSTSGWHISSSPEKKASTVEVAVERAKNYVGDGISYSDVIYSHEAYIVNLAAAVISASNIYAEDIESFGYSEDSNGNPLSGYKLETKGGSDGKGMIKSVGMKANNATFTNSTIERDCQVYGTLVNQDEDGNVVLKTEQSNLSVSTMSSTRTDGTSNPNAFMWSSYYNVLRNRCANRTANEIYSCTSSINGTSYKGYCNKTSVTDPPTYTEANSHYYSSATTVDFPFTWTQQESFLYNGSGNNRVTVRIKVPENYPSIKIRSIHIASNQYSTGSLWWTENHSDWYKLTIGTRQITYFAGKNSGEGWDPSSTVQAEDFSNLVAYPGETITAEFGGKHGSSMANFKISLYESDSWSTGLKLIKSDGTLVDFSSDVPSSGWGTSAQTFTDDGVNYNITFSASASWPVTKYYSFQWDSAPSNSTNRTTSFVDEGSLLVYNGTSLSSTQIGSATFSKSGITIISTTGASFQFVSGGYYTQYRVVLATQDSILGIYAKNLMPVSADSNVGAADSAHLWNAVYCNTIYSNNQAAISKRSMKENIKPWKKDALALLEGVEIVGFNYISDREKNYHIGFIADDTDEALAGIQHDRMDTTNCIGVLIKAVQELTERIKLLEEK